MKVKYSAVSVKGTESVRDFLKEHFGFSYSKTTSISENEQGLVVGENESDTCYLLLLESPVTADAGHARIIVRTDDCIRDYVNLKDQGIRIVGEPQYGDIGLTVDVEDDLGNHYTLLEERRYEDQL